MADEGDEDEDHGPFQDWLLRGIADGLFRLVPLFDGDTVPDREPTGTNPWRPRGPLDVGGRARAIALDPELASGRPRAVYAGTAAGGVFRTLDDGLTWASIWPYSRPSQAIGALAAGATATHRYLWVGTGERDRLPGDGVWLAKLPLGTDGEPVWSHAATPQQLAPAGTDPQRPPRYLEAAAVDPDDPRTCWFVGPGGVHRCTENADGTFARSSWRIGAGAGNSGRTGPAACDVKFVRSGARSYVVLACQDTAWGDLILIPQPDAAEAVIQGVIDAAFVTAANPGAGPGANLAAPLLSGAPPFTPPATRLVNARLAILPGGATDRVYVLYASADKTPDTSNFQALLRADAIGPGPAWAVASAWTSVQTAATLQAAGTPVTGQGQGDYNLYLIAQGGAVGGDLVAWGMVDNFVSVDSGAHFTQTTDWRRYDDGDLGHHADQHAAVMAPGPTWWIANDGGVTRSSGFLDPSGQPVPAVVLNNTPGGPQLDRVPGVSAGWRRSVVGLVCAMPYDLSASPALPDVQAIAIQDIGGWLDGGGGAWRHVEGGDGLGIAFDPNDPHHLVTVNQGGDDTLRACNNVLFEGGEGLDASLYRRPFAVTNQRVLSRGFVPHRPITLGVKPDDRGSFEDTVVHPTESGKILHIRERRLYVSRDGEEFRLADVGDRFEIFARLHATPTTGLFGVVVQVDGPAALKLGFMPSETSDLFQGPYPSPPRTSRVRVVNGGVSRFDLAANDRLTITVELCLGAAASTRFRRTFPLDFPPIASGYQYSDVLRVLRTLDGAQLANWTPIGGGPAQALQNVTFELFGLPAFSSTYGEDAGAVEIVSRDLGANIDLTLGGTAAPKLFSQARAYGGRVGRPAVVTLWGKASSETAAAIAGGETIEVQAHNAAAASGSAWSYTVPDSFWTQVRPLADVLDTARRTASAPAQVWPICVTKYVRLRSGRANAAAFTAFTVDPTSSAFGALTGGGSAPSGAVQFADLKPRLRGRHDLRTTGTSRLTITIGGTSHDIDFLPAAFGGQLDSATVEEVARVIHAGLAGTDVVAEVQRDVTVARPYEVAYSPSNPRVIWVGATNHLWVSVDEGTSWDERMPPPTVASGLDWVNFVEIEAIAPDPFPPSDPADPEYTALVGARDTGVTLLRVSNKHPAQKLDGIAMPSGYVPAHPGDHLKIYALEADPRRRDTYYAATELGVYRSTSGGSSWSAFSVGLPHCPAIDLALDAATDTLRVSLLGRGVFEKYLGDGEPALPDVWLRANSRDAGRRPVAHGADLLGNAPVTVDAARSPDLVLTTLPAASLAALDLFELEQLPSEPARLNTVHQIVVRVRNRSATRIDDARVCVLWADASNELPQLGVAFWRAFEATTVPAGSTYGRWTAIGDQIGISIEPGGAAAVTFAWDTTNVPHLLGVASQVALVAIAARGLSAIEPGPSDVARLAVRNAQVALRLADVRREDTRVVAVTVVRPDTAVALPTALPPPDPPSHAPAIDLDMQVPQPAPLGWSPLGSPFPGPAAQTTAVPAAGWDLAANPNLSLGMTDWFVPPGGGPRVLKEDLTVTASFVEARFTAPTAVTAPELRAFLTGKLRRSNRLTRVGSTDVVLAIRRSPSDRFARIDGASWQSAELVATAAGAAATDDDFAVLALATAADVATGVAQRFSARVWNDGELDATGATLRIYAVDAAAATPAATQLGTQTITIPAGTSAIGFVEATVTGDNLLILAQIDHAADPEAAPTFTTWDGVVDILRSRRTAIRMFRRRA